MNTEFRKEQKDQEEHNGDQTWMMATVAISSRHEVAADMNHKKNEMVLNFGSESSIS